MLPIKLWSNIQSQSVYDMPGNRSVTILNMIQEGRYGLSLYIRCVVEQKDAYSDYPYQVSKGDDKGCIEAFIEINQLGDGSEKELFIGGKIIPTFLTRFVDRGRNIYKYKILQLNINTINHETGIIQPLKANT